MFSRLKLITFDAKDTIMTLKKSAGMLYGETAKIYGINVENQELILLEKSFGPAFNSINSTYPNYGKPNLSLIDWWSLVIERTFRDSKFDESRLSKQVLQQITIHAFKSFASTECWNVKGNTIADLNLIKITRPDIKLGVISNGDQRLEVLLLQLGLRHFFDFVIDSQSTGFEKPSKEIFDLAIDQANLQDPYLEDSNLALHVGDDLTTDYHGAISAGWNAMLLVDEDKVETFKTKVKNPSHVITSLSQIVER